MPAAAPSSSSAKRRPVSVAARLPALLSGMTAALAAGMLPALASAQTFDTPVEDRWFYPFNLSGLGSRPTASCFAASALNGFNDRDGTLVVIWDTTTDIPAGQGAYAIESIRVVLSAASQAEWIPDTTVDEWFTADLDLDGSINADGIPRGEPGDTDGESSDQDPGRPIELFGVGFTNTSLATWQETDLYIGADSLTNAPRDPFPFVHQDGTGELLHVEDHVKGLHNDTLPNPVFSFTPQPWAIGSPVGYTPGAMTEAFDVEFDIDLDASAGLVDAYFQQGLDAGRVAVYITSFQQAQVQGPTQDLAVFYTKEGVGFETGALAPRLIVTLAPACPGDINTTGTTNGVPDGQTNLSDLQFFLTEWQNDLGMTPGSLADVNTTGTTNGIPDGEVNLSDLQFYLTQWQAGLGECP